MSQYINQTKIGQKLVHFYETFLHTNALDIPVFTLTNVPSSDPEYKDIMEMKRLGLVSTKETRPELFVYLTERGKRHGSQFTRILDNIPELI